MLFRNFQFHRRDPIVILILIFRKIRNECPLWADGIKIDRHHASADKKIEDLFNKILEGIVSLRDKEQFAGKDYSLGMLVEKFLDIQEATQRETLLGMKSNLVLFSLDF